MPAVGQRVIIVSTGVAGEITAYTKRPFSMTVQPDDGSDPVAVTVPSDVRQEPSEDDHGGFLGDDAPEIPEKG